MTRRHFMRRWLIAGLASLGLGFKKKSTPRRVVSEKSDSSAPLVRSNRFLRTVPFQGEGDHPLDQFVGKGLGGRRALDLSRLRASEMITPNESFFVRTAAPEGLSPTDKWTIEVGGLVASPATIALDEEIAPTAEPMGVHLIECAGNDRDGHFGLISASEWTGVRVAKILERLEILSSATAVLISGYDEHSTGDPGSTPGASWIFTFEQLRTAGAFLATGMNGRSLLREHGHPVRLVVPGWYGCCCIKWVNRIEVVDDRAESTEHMKEFAGRTFQDAHGPLDLLLPRHDDGFGPRFAKDYQPAVIDSAALPLRVEQWMTDEELIYRVVGILWGGATPTDDLVIRFHPGEEYVPVESCQQETTQTWTFWSHTWRPEATGRYRIQLRISDPAISTRRLDVGYYEREVDIKEI